MRQIRARIRVAKNIQQITKAMKMVAAARLRRAQERVGAARPYSEKMREVMESLARATAGGSLSHPLLEVREPVKIGVLTITADRGLCGSYATNILRKTADTLRPYRPEDVRAIPVGRKGHAFFRRRPYPVTHEFDLNMTGTAFAEAQEIARHARDLFVSGEVDVLYMVYTRFFSALVQKPTVVQLLPITPAETEDEVAEEDAAGESGGEEYIFEPVPARILEQLLPRYVDTQIYQALLEAVASEHGARMTAMSSATDNAGKMINSLTLVLNRARQAIITKEIAEIVGGAEALK